MHLQSWKLGLEDREAKVRECNAAVDKTTTDLARVGALAQTAAAPQLTVDADTLNLLANLKTKLVASGSGTNWDACDAKQAQALRFLMDQAEALAAKKLLAEATKCSHSSA